MAYTVDLSATHEPFPNTAAAAAQYTWLGKVTDNLLVLSGWTDWSVTLKRETTDPTFGTGGVEEGWYVHAGQFFRGGLTFVAGTGGTAGSGNHYVDMPGSVTWAHPVGTVVGAGYAAPTSGAGEMKPVEVTVRSSSSLYFWNCEENVTDPNPAIDMSDADSEMVVWICGRTDE